MAKYLTLENYSIAKGIKEREQYVVLEHIKTICKYLELCFAGALPDGKKNLIINIPPRHSKTHTVENWIELSMGLLPDCEFIYASYSLKLAKKSVVSMRNTLNKPWFQEMFPHCRLNKDDSTTMEYFTTTMGGAVLASGLDGTIVGFGAGKLRAGFAGAIIIDDPIKIKDAKSALARMNAQEGYTGTLKTRRNSNDTPIIVMGQRTNKDDLSGYIMKEEADDFFLLKIPAYDFETKKTLWEDRITAKQLMIMKEVDPFTFYSQYQQEPITLGGSIIKEKWWSFYDDKEEIIKRCSFIAIFVDTAMKEKDHNDYSVFQVWGFEGTKRAFLLDQERGKWDFPKLLMVAKQFWAKWSKSPYNLNARCMFIEDKVSGTSLVQTLQSQGIPTEPWSPKEFDAPDDKVSRAKESSFFIFGGMVFLPNPDTIKGHEWVDDEYIPEWNAFTENDSHPHDDQIDPTTMALLTWKDGGAYVEGLNLSNIESD